jgi:hypothetical protein
MELLIARKGNKFGVERIEPPVSRRPEVSSRTIIRIACR